MQTVILKPTARSASAMAYEAIADAPTRWLLVRIYHAATKPPKLVENNNKQKSRGIWLHEDHFAFHNM